MLIVVLKTQDIQRFDIVMSLNLCSALVWFGIHVKSHILAVLKTQPISKHCYYMLQAFHLAITKAIVSNISHKNSS